MTVPNDSNTYLPGTIQIPSSLLITGLTNSDPMIATVEVNDLSESNTYIPGQLVRLTVPIIYGMWQADGMVVRILEVTDDQITLDISSTHFDVFVTPSEPQGQPASLAPSGSRNLTLDNTTIQVPFQSLNNIGN